MRMLLAAAVVACLATAACAGERSMRCGTRLVLVGDTTPEVVGVCGTPDGVDWHFERVVSEISPYTFVFDEILVERWTYDLGPHLFARDLVFRDGVLADVELRGYGPR